MGNAENGKSSVERFFVSSGLSPLAFSASSEAIAQVPSSDGSQGALPPYLQPRARSESIMALVREDLRTVSAHFQSVHRELQDRFDEVLIGNGRVQSVVIDIR